MLTFVLLFTLTFLLLLMFVLPELWMFVFPELLTFLLPALLAPPVEGVVLGFALEEGVVAGWAAGAVEGLAALELDGWPAAPDLLGAAFPCARLAANEGLAAISREQHSRMRSRWDPAGDLDCVRMVDALEDRKWSRPGRRPACGHADAEHGSVVHAGEPVHAAARASWLTSAPGGSPTLRSPGSPPPRAGTGAPRPRARPGARHPATAGLTWAARLRSAPARRQGEARR